MQCYTFCSFLRKKGTIHLCLFIFTNQGGVGTVGAVAIDAQGQIAVATSTGGLTGKAVGRIGDTPMIGSGTYADDNVGGVSCTGRYFVCYNKFECEVRISL